MPILFLLILALVQGVTEFLPVSSSGHLILTWALFDSAGAEAARLSESERLLIDISVHCGTLGAVCLYFWRDLAAMTGGFIKLLGGQRGPGARLAVAVLIGTLPVILVGFLAKDFITQTLRSAEVIAWTTLLFGLLLYVADKVGLTVRRVEHLTLVQAGLIGLSQCLALIPGTSRSGITMTAARFFGYERAEAARFSMLLSIPAILGAGTLAALDLYKIGDLALTQSALVALALSFFSALIAIALMMAWLKRASFTPFVIYRVLLAGVLFWLLYGGGAAAL
ncbi:MAG: undecaprenyl-diphosphate phosphatase [Limibacillus sp.]